MSSISQSLVAKSGISVEVFELAKSELLQAVKKVNSLIASQEQCADKTVETSVVNHDQPTTEANVDGSAPNVTLRNPVQKRKQGDQKGRIKNGVEKKGGKKARKSKDANATVGKLRIT